ncbi:MAG TPA: hypothetical protein VK968_01140 [Roseimicrobium sp.]|nr:hypothetical protein [Roseimicrobium sp.]
MNIDGLFIAAVTASIFLFAGLALFYERRQKRFEPTRARDNVFRCEKCGFVYTDDPDVDCSKCSQCGMMNDEVKF